MTDISVDAQYEAVRAQVLREKRKGKVIPALEEAERTLRRIKLLRYNVENTQNGDLDHLSEVLADEIYSILGLDHSDTYGCECPTNGESACGNGGCRCN